MSTVTDIDRGEDALREIVHLRSQLLAKFLPFLPVAAWACAYYALFGREDLKIASMPFVATSLATYGVWKLRERHHQLASWLLLLSLILVQSLAVAIEASCISVAIGVTIVIAASALLGTCEGFVAATLTWVASISAQCFVDGEGILRGWNIDVLLLYYMTWGATWLSRLPFKESVEMALAGWKHARDALAETRQRRAELYRVLRSLEEATYRIEHLNNELLLARNDAEQARASKSKFVATVSHELRSPLNLILGFSRMIALAPEKYGELLPTAYRADVDAIYRNSRHLATLVDDVLDLSQIEAARLALIKDQVDLEREVVARVIRTVRPLAERKGLYLREELDHDLPRILADVVRLRQALMNLLMNAVRFTNQGGITIRAIPRNQHIQLSVQDTGPGIAPENMPGLFKEFSRLHRSNTREEAGTGLGLSITKELVELHGGKVWAESKLHVGTTIHMLLPLPGAETSQVVRTTENRPHTLAPDTCVVVHHAPALVRTLARLLEGYQVVGAPTEREALMLIEDLHPRAVIATPTVADEIERKLAQTPYDVPIVSCSIPSVTDQEHLAGVIGYLIKPIVPEMLVTVTKQAAANAEPTVLLVDDDPDTVRLMEMILTSAMVTREIVHAYGGFEALRIMEEITPDLAFVDLVMPELGGEELIARMRADDRLRRVPVVIVSARDPVESGLAIEAPISVRCRSRLSPTRSAKVLLALLDALSACYAPYVESTQ